jgi:hypothetical protein
MIGEVMGRVVDEEPEQAGYQHLHAVRKGRHDGLTAEWRHQHSASKTREHGGYPTRQRVAAGRDFESGIKIYKHYFAKNLLLFFFLFIVLFYDPIFLDFWFTKMLLVFDVVVLLFIYLHLMLFRYL